MAANVDGVHAGAAKLRAMTEAAAPPPPPRNELADALRRPLWQVAVLVVAAAALATAAMGGFRTASSRPTASLPFQPPGATVDSGLFAVTAGAAWITDTRPGLRLPSQDTHYLVVPLTVENRDDGDFGSSMRLGQDVVLLQTGADGAMQPVEADMILRADAGGGFGAALPPRLAVPLLAIWKRPPGAPPPPHVDLGLGGRTLVEATFLTRERAWTPARAVGKWRLPVGAAPGSAAPAEPAAAAPATEPAP